jgi:predicted Zn-dependent protease
METDSESELAGVLAHEVAHVTQRHIARSIQNQGRASLVSTAAMLAAILLGAVGGGGSNATMGAISAAQGMAAQSQINFTRENEYEADRVGIGIMAQAGFDPSGMPKFFETMGRRTQLGPDQIPEMLRTHPVTSARIAESKSRAAQYPVIEAHDSLSYALMKERLRVLATPAGQDPRDYYASTIENEPDASQAQVYGRALAQIQGGDPAAAIPTPRAHASRAAGSPAVPYGTGPGTARRGRRQGCTGHARKGPRAGASQRPGHGALCGGA